MHISKLSLTLLSILLLLLLIALPFSLPSGTLTQEAFLRYENSAYDEDSDLMEDWDLSRETRWTSLGLIASVGATDVIFDSEIISPLPFDNSPGRNPISGNYTETGYQDDTILVEMEQKRMFDSEVFIAHVKIATPSQLRTAYAGNKMNSTRTNHTSRLSSNFNGIVAINGDYYPKTKAGYIVRQTEVYREKTSNNMDLLLIDELGDFHLILRGNDNQKAAILEFKETHEIINGFFFGPALVIDGHAQEIPKNYQFDPGAPNPRAAIGQTGPLSYIMVAVNGRTDNSRGVTMTEFATLMEELGCLQAYNLDGGNSATLAFRGNVYNDKPQAERSVTDIIYFATATQQE